jgi:serine/threonine-protein kinase
VSYIPLAGTHLGLIYKDLDFETKNIKVYSSIHNVMVNCLAVPDAFLAKKDYENAYNEYKRIAQSFPGRTESLQALFRSGITILEKAKTTNDKTLFQKALDEFSLLHKTAEAPLEYLGKSLVYASLLEIEEEAKCLELAIRKFHKHPLLPILKEHLVYRIHESLLQERETAYRLILLSILFIPSIKNNPDIKDLIINIQKSSEKIYFIIPSKKTFPIDLSYRLAKTHTLSEILEALLKDEEKNKIDIKNTFFALLDLKDYETIEKFLNKEKYPFIAILLDIAKKEKDEINITLALNETLKLTSKKNEKETTRAYIYLFKLALNNNLFQIVEDYIDKISIPKESEIFFDSLEISAYLLKKDFQKAEELLLKYPSNILNDPSLPLHPIYGIYLYKTKSPEIAMNHFSEVLEKTYPQTPSLLSYYLTEKMDKWFKYAFFWEKKELYRHLSLFYGCIGDSEKQNYFSEL